MEPTQPTQQPNGFNQPGQAFSPQGQIPNAGQVSGNGDGQAASAPQQDPVDPQLAQRVSQQLAAVQQQLRSTGHESDAMLLRAFEQAANEPAGPPPETESAEGELIIRPQQPNGNWNGDNNGNSN